MGSILKVGEEKAELRALERSLLEGVVSRAGTLFFTWSFISTLYGFLSVELFRQKIPDITVWDNVWPRVVFSSLPLLLTALWYKQNTRQTVLKAYLTPFLLPFFLLCASLIKAWPLFWQGHYDFYLQFHATNIIAMSSGIFVISASPRMVLAQSFGFILFYFGPLLMLFGDHQPQLGQMIISDAMMVTIILIVTLKSIHKLRLSVAVDELQRRKKASLFLGKNLAQAIYQTTNMVVDDYTRDGLVMSVDLRGYTKFIQSVDRATVRAFMSDYHALVNKTISSRKSYLHKTIGDGLLITFGVMDNETDLSDLPDASEAHKRLEETKKAECLRQAAEVFLGISRGLEELSIKHGISLPLVIGCGCAYGAIDVVVHGDDSYRQELDIQGTAIVRSVRLEAYSKLLTVRIDPESSFLLVSPELASSVEPSLGFKMWMITSANEQVRDFPEIKSILFRQWKHNRARENRSAA